MVGTADISSGLHVPGSDRPSPISRRHKFHRVWPYIRGATLSVVCIWTSVGLYLALTPPTYVSRWTLNLPGSASNVSVSLESIGQSSSTPNSPFASSSLSPKVVYKEIAEGDKVRAAAADKLGLTLKAFGKPRVKLIDETALMMFEMAANSPDDAQRRSNALLAAFNAELEDLRSNELELRASAVRKNLKDYQAQVHKARENMVRAQMETGLVSTNQFSEMVTMLTGLRRRWSDLRGEADKLQEEQTRLIERLGVAPGVAQRALKLSGDPALLKALGEYNDAATLFAADNERFGRTHPQLMASGLRRDAARARIKALLEKSAPGANAEFDLGTLLSFAGNSPTAELYATLVRNDATLQGRQKELMTLATETARVETEVSRLSGAASRLEDLKKDQIVADAVFSSAMARLDSSKSDIHGSYPIAQVVASPDLPEFRSQPRLLYAALGGVSGSVFACLAWMLAWLQFVHRSTRSRSA